MTRSVPLGLGLSFLLALGCSSGSGDGGSGTGTDTDPGTSTDATGSTGAATDGGSTGGGSTGGGSTCPLGDKTFKYSLEVPAPDPAPDPDDGMDTRNATCDVNDVSTAGQEMTVMLSCDESPQSLDQPYVLRLTLPEGNSVNITNGGTLQVLWTSWWTTGVGKGQRLSLRVGDQVILAIYDDEVGGGVAGNCLAPTDPPRAEAQTWLNAFMATIVDAECDDLGTYALDLGASEILPGETSNVALPMPQGAMNILLDQARCFVDGTAESWTFRFVGWQG